MKEKIVFLDRDGTVNEEPEDEIVDSIQKASLLPNTVPALKLLMENEFQLFFITNQVGIGEGRLNTALFHKINNHILWQLEKEGIRIVDTFFCPHGIEDNCRCRKPKPGMLKEARRKYGVDLEKAYVIGDRRTDVQLGKNVGSKTILVMTGKDSPDGTIKPDYIAKDLLDATNYVLTNSGT